jgi:hypothetical protein
MLKKNNNPIVAKNETTKIKRAKRLAWPKAGS